MPHTPGIGAIFGIVSENGVAKASGRVALYDRTTLNLVNQTTADSLGGYQFTGLNQNTTDYLVMAVDDNGTPPKNALVQDYIQPIPAHMGAVAYTNWELRARRNDPSFLWVPRLQGSVAEPMGAGSWASTRFGASGALLWYQSAVTPGAPHFPTIKLNTGAVWFPAFQVGRLWPYTGVDNFSLEFIFNSTYDSQVSPRGFRYDNLGYRDMGLAGVSFNATTKVFRYSASNATTNTLNMVLSDTAQWNTATYTATGLSAGIHHVVLVISLSVSMKLYIDGALVATTSLAGGNSTFAPSSFLLNCADSLCSFGGICTTAGTTIAQGLGLFGPTAGYHRVLDATEVANLYNDLMVGTSPAATGYVREILTDSPAILYRLNEGSYGTATEYLTNLPSSTHYGTITFTVPSPVTGGALTHFGGGATRAIRGAGGGSAVQRSWEFWVKPDTSAPAGNRTMFAGHYQADAGQFWWKVMQVQTTGILRLVLTCGTNASPVVETLNFTYVMPTSVVKHLVIVLDKVALLCKLYVDGVFQEQVATTGSYLSEGDTTINVNPTSPYDTILTIGGWVTSAIAISEAFQGSLGDFSLYYRALTPDRIQAHYDSRLLI